MAVDEALARCRAPGEAVLRVYRWSRPTLSFGRNQPARGRYDDGIAPLLGGDVVRRPTGGREVLHDRELTYAVVLPLRALGGLREAYIQVNAALVEALRSLGVAAEAAPRRGSVPSPSAGACFAEAAPGEVTVGGRKLVGSAQARVDGSLLQHGSLLLAPPTLSLGAFKAPPGVGERAREGAPGGRHGPWEGAEMDGAVTLSELLEPGHRGHGFSVVAGAVESALAGSFGGEWRRGGLLPEEVEVARSILPHYQSSTWTWRR
jgi:hypothetical protein